MQSIFFSLPLCSKIISFSASGFVRLTKTSQNQTKPNKPEKSFHNPFDYWIGKKTNDFFSSIRNGFFPLIEQFGFIKKKVNEKKLLFVVVIVVVVFGLKKKSEIIIEKGQIKVFFIHSFGGSNSKNKNFDKH